MVTAKTGKSLGIAGLCLFTMVLVGVSGGPLRADDESLQERMERMEAIIRQQQADIEAQRRQLAEQYELIRQLQSARQAKEPAGTPAGTGEPSPSREAYAQQPSAGQEPAAPAPAGNADLSGQYELSGEEAALAELEERTQAGTEEPAVDPNATLYDRSSSVYDPEFPGAWHMPGTTAALKIGGYVNLAGVHSFDLIGSSDSFVVGSIPTKGSDVSGVQSGTNVSADQSRINLEVRQHTKTGVMRAFVEGDFRTDGSQFRLRHAYGQYGWILAGKTWTAFANVNALPDEVDFESVPGTILQRQSQLRFFPRLGKNNNLLISIEDPTTDVQNGIGTPGHGDIVVSLDSLPLGSLGDWNYKVAAVYRELEGQPLNGPTTGQGLSPDTDSTTGWGITTSGRTTVPYWGDDDFIQWQLTYGEGLGHYINDLATIGGGDAVFDPQGRLRALPVFAGFLSYNHNWQSKPWFLKKWPGLIRSNLVVSWVDVDNYDFQGDDSYNKTWRASTNLFYFPTQNVRLGAEFLWGKRINKDGLQGSATQLQISARFDY